MPEVPSGLARVCVVMLLWAWSGPVGLVVSGPHAQGGAREQGAALTGRVVAADSGSPLRRAQVTLASSDGRVRLATTTDGDGRYGFGGLPAGRYTLAAVKTGFVRLEYGQLRAFEVGRPLSLAEGEQISGVHLPLPRGAVIVVRVTDDRAEPVVGAMVLVQRHQFGPDGEPRLATVTTSGVPALGTDDRGLVRAYGLMPGEYVVSAMPPPVPSPSGPGEAGSGPGVALVTTFYPGTVEAAAAQALSVAVGEEAIVELPMVTGRLARISGTVVDSTGRAAAGASISLETYRGTTQFGGSGGTVSDDGTFSVAGVAPGEHWLRVTHRSAAEFAAMPVTVSGSDITNVHVATGPGATVAGAIDVSGGARPPGTVRVRLRPVGAFQAGSGSMSSDPVGDDGSFRIEGASGRVLLDVTAPAGWSLLSARMGGRDVTDEPIDLTAGGTLSDVVIAIAGDLPRVTGRVRDASGALVRRYAVVLQPAGTLEPAAAARRVQVMRPDEEGRFESAGLRPGRYVVTALEGIENGRQYSPAFRQMLRQFGREFAVGQNGDVALDLTLTTGR